MTLLHLHILLFYFLRKNLKLLFMKLILNDSHSVIEFIDRQPQFIFISHPRLFDLVSMAYYQSYQRQNLGISLTLTHTHFQKMLQNASIDPHMKLNSISLLHISCLSYTRTFPSHSDMFIKVTHWPLQQLSDNL